MGFRFRCSQQNQSIDSWIRLGNVTVLHPNTDVLQQNRTTCKPLHWLNQNFHQKNGHKMGDINQFTSDVSDSPVDLPIFIHIH